MPFCRAAHGMVLGNSAAESRLPMGRNPKWSAVEAGLGQDLGSWELRSENHFPSFLDSSRAPWCWPGSHSSQLPGFASHVPQVIRQTEPWGPNRPLLMTVSLSGHGHTLR